MEKTFNIPNFKIYNIYSDNMLIQQNKPFVIMGTGDKGLKINLLLKLRSDIIQSVTAIANEDGEWKASFNAITGGFDVYSIEVFLEDRLIATIDNILFGELWLASGQSNMLMNNWETPEGNEWYKTNSFPGKKNAPFYYAYYIRCRVSKSRTTKGIRWMQMDYRR